VQLIDVTRLPRHVAIIMDGNGRWAEGRGMQRPIGHREGSDAVRRTVRAARRLGVEALTLFAFSEQNWDRPSFEVQALMELLREFLLTERQELLDNGIRLRSVGRTNRLPPHVRDVLDQLCAETAACDDMVLTLALSYGGREEIADAARALAGAAARGELDPERIDERLFDAYVPSASVGPVDLLIRTGGERRISNFLLWGAAYAELYFSDRLWPEYREEDLHAAIAEFQSRSRRFGRVQESRVREEAPPKCVDVASGSQDG
jgi:undecaprenyl diphosphate synthase